MVKPYYAVIFTSILVTDAEGYHKMAAAIESLAKIQSGFLGMESARDDIGITVSYWQSEAAILAWKQNTDHLMAQKLGKEKWYKSYHIRICKVEREYDYHSLSQ